MIISFKVKNFRSIKEEQVFSMEAANTEARPENVRHIQLASGEKLRLLTSAAIFGANASGKSNVVNALGSLFLFLVQTDTIEIDKPIPSYDSFRLQSEMENAPTHFELVFTAEVQKELHKFKYTLAYNAEKIIEESLYYYPKKKAALVFMRNSQLLEKDENLHSVKLGDKFGVNLYEVHKKIPFLSIFKKAQNYHTFLSTIFEGILSIPVSSMGHLSGLRSHTVDQLTSDKNRLQKLNALLRLADIGFEGIKIEGKKGDKWQHRLYGVHKKLYADGEGVILFPFSKESEGTKTLFDYGHAVILALDAGIPIIIDELENSLHPHLVLLILQMFQSEKYNPKGAQLIFSTHETEILHKGRLRSDQIWFTEKNANGETTLFSAQDFDDVREDIPFEKWYHAGRFGAVPNIGDLDKLFSDEQETNPQ